MRTATIISLAADAPPLDSCYRFDHGQERFAGVVDNVVRIGEHAVEITLSMTAAEHERLLASRALTVGATASSRRTVPSRRDMGRCRRQRRGKDGCDG